MAPPLSTPPPAFVEVPLRPRFFQSSAFFPMPVVLIATRAPGGPVNLAPYSLCFPHVTSEGHRLVLVTRSASKTAMNLIRTGRASISFLADSPDFIQQCKTLAAPVATADKMTTNAFTWQPSALGKGLDGTDAPPILNEAVQVFECKLFSTEMDDDGGEFRFVLDVEAIRMPPEWAAILERGGRGPRLPVDYGFRHASESWHSRPGVVTFGPRLRPRFDIILNRDPKTVIADFQAGLARPDVALDGKVRGDSLQIGLPPAEVNTWSPSLDLRIEPHEGGGTIVRGRIGPQPQVWTTFMFFHMMIAMVGLGGLMWGIAQMVAGGSGWPMWILPGALVLHVFVAGAAFIGQGLGADQTHRLRSFVDDVVGD